MPYKRNIGSGDDGTTQIYGRRISKSSSLILLNALIDEVNALIGDVIAKDRRFRFLKEIEKINSVFISYNAGYYSDERIEGFIKKIDDFIKRNSDFEIKEFVYFNKNKTASALNLVRTKVRVAEIYAWKAKKTQTARYLNRLSDLFFILAYKCENGLRITSHQVLSPQ